MTRLLCSICSVLALTASMAVHAQLRDIRLAPELRDYSLPQEAQVQSVASIGNRSLVAWASTAFDPDSNIINVLWMRLLDGSTPLLENRIVHSPQARPYGFVLVIASADQFLIFFNDRRNDAPGTYVQRMDFNGNRIGTEQRIDIGAVKNDTINKPKSEVSALSYSWLPGWTFVQVDSARPFVVRDNAVVDTRPLAIDHMQGAYYLAEDTSVAVLRGKSLYFYRNLFDTEAEHVVTVPGLDSALAASEVVMKDTSGIYKVLYAVVSNPRTFACSYFTAIATHDSTGQPTKLFDDYNPFFDLGTLDYACYGFVRQRGCDNMFRLVVKYKGWYYTEYHGIQTPYAVFPVYTTDVVHNGTILRSSLPEYTQVPLCLDIKLPIRRVTENQSTNIIVSAATDTVTLIVHTAFVRPLISRSVPNLFLDENELITSWFYNDNPNKPEPGIWDTQTPSHPIILLDTLAFWHMQFGGSGSGIIPGSLAINEKVRNLNGRTFGYSSQSRNDEVRPSTLSIGNIYNVYLEARVLTRRGWITIYKEGGSGQSGIAFTRTYPPPDLGIRAYGYDLLTHHFYLLTRSLYWESYDHPLGETFKIYSLGSEPYDSSIASLIWKPNHQRLSTDRWLRWHLADDSTRWSFDVVDTAGTIYHSRTLQLDGDPRSIFVTQNYPDRSTAVIWGGIGGVRGTFLSHSLDILQENVQISQTRDSVSYPSAAYRNDTLFVAWEDYRNGGIADVYGAAFTGAPMASSVEVTQNTQTRREQLLSLWPNPARDHLRITLPQHSGAASLEILDALGRLHTRVDLPAGAIAHELDLRTLEPGVYIAQISGSAFSRSARFVVTH